MCFWEASLWNIFYPALNRLPVLGIFKIGDRQSTRGRGRGAGQRVRCPAEPGAPWVSHHPSPLLR